MDIISLPIKFDKTKIDGTYRLVMAAVKRAKTCHRVLCLLSLPRHRK